MPLAIIPYEASMTDILDAASYTLGQLASHPLAATYTPKFDAFLTDWTTANQARTALVIAAAKAQGAVEGADAALDNFVDLLDRTLLIVVKNDRTAPQYQSFFGDKAPYLLKRPILSDELTTCRAWVPTLQASTIAALSALAPQLITVVAAANTAVAGKLAADQALKDYDTIGGKKALVDEFNALRKTVYGALAALPHQNPTAMLPGDFADRFFPHEGRTGITALTNPKDIQAKIDSLTKSVNAAQTHLATVNAKTAAKAAQRQAAQEAAAALTQAKKEEAAAKQKTKDAQKAAKQAKKKTAASAAAAPTATTPAASATSAATPTKGT